MKKRKRIFSGLLLLILIISIPYLIKSFVGFLYPLRYEAQIRESAQRYDLDEYLVMALIKAESNYVPTARSNVAHGLMQITENTGEWIAEKLKQEFRPEDLENPKKNIEMGCYYLRYLIDRYQNREVALAAYNAGMGNVTKWLSDSRYSNDAKTLSKIPFPETEQYIQKIDRYYQVYQFLYNHEKKG